MRDQQNGDTKLLIERFQQRENRTGGFRIERRRSFVTQQQRRAGGKRNADALFLSTGERRRIVSGLVAQPHQRQQFRYALVALCLFHASYFQRQRHILRHGFCRQQIEVLKHHADATAHRLQLLFRQTGNTPPFNLDYAFVGRLQPVETANQRRFSGAAAPDQAKDFAFLHRQ